MTNMKSDIQIPSVESWQMFAAKSARATIIIGIVCQCIISFAVIGVPFVKIELDRHHWLIGWRIFEVQSVCSDPSVVPVVVFWSFLVLIFTWAALGYAARKASRIWLRKRVMMVASWIVCVACLVVMVISSIGFNNSENPSDAMVWKDTLAISVIISGVPISHFIGKKLLLRVVKFLPWLFVQDVPTENTIRDEK